jgi:phosphohistidine phosphatase
MRHGDAGNRKDINNDLERSLTAEGREEVEKIAKSLKSLKLDVDMIATSPLKRALETAEIVAEIFQKTKKLETWNELSPEGERMDLLERLSRLNEESTVLLVGHEPYLSTLMGDLISNKPGTRIVLKKGGAAKIVINSLLPKASGELRWLLTPRQLKKLS